MFVTLLGSLPRPPLPDDAAAEAVLDAVLALQAEHGLEPLTDAGWGVGHPDPVASWRASAARTDRMVKAVIDGPWSHRVDPAVTRATLLGLVDAGCGWIEIHEPGLARLAAEDAAGRARFGEIHAALTDGLDGIHLTLAVTGGAANAAGIETVLAGAYSSLAVDLIDGPDNWYLVTATPPTLGVVCGALSTRPDSDDRVEVLLWAGAYAASTAGRGADRVGLATAGSLAALPWSGAERKLRVLGEAGRLAQLPPDELKRRVDPRSLDLRSAALGRYDPPSERPRRVSAKSRKSSSPGD
ncbi:MAG TPA: hypothetical protein VD763_00015 [Candidatus Saccharimonadales bacterium]|nr:hypothetical protein [Candidatus Saccharimonadales bacterium]